jgi:hypothetical protein
VATRSGTVDMAVKWQLNPSSIPQNLWPLFDGDFGGSCIKFLHVRIQFPFSGWVAIRLPALLVAIVGLTSLLPHATDDFLKFSFQCCKLNFCSINVWSHWDHLFSLCIRIRIMAHCVYLKVTFTYNIRNIYLSVLKINYKDSHHWINGNNRMYQDMGHNALLMTHLQTISCIKHSLCS